MYRSLLWFGYPFIHMSALLLFRLKRQRDIHTHILHFKFELQTMKCSKSQSEMLFASVIQCFALTFYVAYSFSFSLRKKKYFYFVEILPKKMLFMRWIAVFFLWHNQQQINKRTKKKMKRMRRRERLNSHSQFLYSTNSHSWFGFELVTAFSQKLFNTQWYLLLKQKTPAFDTQKRKNIQQIFSTKQIQQNNEKKKIENRIKLKMLIPKNDIHLIKKKERKTWMKSLHLNIRLI